MMRWLARVREEELQETEVVEGLLDRSGGGVSGSRRRAGGERGRTMLNAARVKGLLATLILPRPTCSR